VRTAIPALTQHCRHKLLVLLAPQDLQIAAEILQVFAEPVIKGTGCHAQFALQVLPRVWATKLSVPHVLVLVVPILVMLSGVGPEVVLLVMLTAQVARPPLQAFVMMDMPLQVAMELNVALARGVPPRQQVMKLRVLRAQVVYMPTLRG